MDDTSGAPRSADIRLKRADAVKAYDQVAAWLAEEWAVIEPLGNDALTKAHSRLHWGLKALADQYGFGPSGPVAATPTSKPPPASQ